MNTKQLILEKALELFSTKGFQAVSTREIAEAVGVQKGALYNHFKNKQDIFDSITRMVEEHAKQMTWKVPISTVSRDTLKNTFGKMSKEELIELSCQMFAGYMQDEMITKYRRMFMIEQFHNDAIREKYRTYCMDAMIDRVTEMNKLFMETGIYRKANPKAMALLYFAPSFFLMNRYDGGEKELEEALQLLREGLSLFLDVMVVQKEKF